MINEQPVVVITGMHRSGTSLVSSILQRAGVPVGDKLYGASIGNPRGHFEDIDFHGFHEGLLNRFGQTYLVQDAANLGEVTHEEAEKAKTLIEARNDQVIWGWKDPRTVLFLDLWSRLLPGARYVFSYRHPVEVVLSLLRRGAHFDLEVLMHPLAGFRAWQVYNELILDFHLRHPDTCFLGEIHGITTDIAAFVDKAAAKLGLPLENRGTGALFHGTELRSMALSAEAMSAFDEMLPEVAAVYQSLEREADLSSNQSPAQGDRPISSHLGSPEQAISALARHGVLREEELDHYCSLLLTLVAPETVLSGKESLDRARQAHISELEHRILELAQRLSRIEESKIVRLACRARSIADSVIVRD